VHIAHRQDNRADREEKARLQAAAEKEKRELEAAEAKQRKVQASIAEIKAHQKLEKQRLSINQQRELELAEQERLANEQADRDFAVAEQLRQAQRRDGRAGMEVGLQEQAALRATLRQEEKYMSVAEREALERAAELEDAVFREHALRQLEAAQARGCPNVVPLQAVLSGPAKARTTPTNTTAMKRGPGNPYPGNTQRRLGFTWNESS